MASGRITSWQAEGGTVGAVAGLIFLDSEITEDGCSHETERHLGLGRNAVADLGNMLRSRDSPLPTKV